MRPKRIFIAFVLLSSFCFLVVACSGDEDATGSGGQGDVADDATSETETDDEPSNSMAFATYNAGLAVNFVDYAKERVEPVGQLLSESNADVVCGQEIWTFENDSGEPQVDRIVQSTSQNFPHNHYEITQGSGSNSGGAKCTEEELDPLNQCIDQNCPEMTGNELVSCVTSNCSESFGQLSSSCTSCLTSNIDKPIEEVRTTCTSEEGGSSYTSDGHNGLLLLSKHPLSNKKYKDFTSTVVKRGALHVTLDTETRVDVYCTHLAADLSNQVEYSGDEYASYKEEQAGQIDALLSWIDETAETDRIIVMGDMNSGPAIANLDGAFPENYQKFIDADYDNPYLDAESPKCTICSDNSLRESDTSSAIDHIFSKGPAEAVESSRIFDSKVEIETGEGTKQVHPSDHYGVQTRFRINE